MFYMGVKIEASMPISNDEVEHDITEGAARAALRKKIEAALATVEGLEVHDLVIDGWVN